MRRPPIVPVGDVEGAVGAERQVAGGEPGIVGPQDVAHLAGLEGRAEPRDLVGVDRMIEQVGGDVAAPPRRGQRVGLVEQAAHRHVTAADAVVTDVVEVTERVGIVERAVLAERLPVVAALDAVEHDEPADVGAGEELAVAVEVEAPHVAPALAEQLESPRARVVAPDALLELDPADPGRHRAPLEAVEPAVGPPGQGVGHRVGVFHAEAGQEHLGVAVGPVVAVAVRVEQQVRGLEDEDAAGAEGQPARQVQPGHEVVGAVGPAVAVGVLQDGDPIRALRPARRRLGDAVVGGPRIAIDRDALQPGGVGVLQVLDDPEPPAVVELDRHRLADHRLGRDEADLQALGDRHPPRRRFRRKPLRPAVREVKASADHPASRRMTTCRKFAYFHHEFILTTPGDPHWAGAAFRRADTPPRRAAGPRTMITCLPPV